MSFGELIGRAIALYRGRPPLYLVLAAVTVLPVGVLSALVGVAADDLDGGPRAAVLAAVNLVPAVLLLPISGAATAVAVVGALDGRRVTVRGALAPVATRLGPLLGALVLVTLGVASGLVLLVIPGLVVLIYWLFAAPAVVVEDRGAVDGLRRSQDLVRGAWWTVFAAWFLIQLIAAAAILVLGLPGDAVGGTVTAGVWATLVALVVQPFALIAIALLYVDRVVRTEGRLPGSRPG